MRKMGAELKRVLEGLASSVSSQSPMEEVSELRGAATLLYPRIKRVGKAKEPLQLLPGLEYVTEYIVDEGLEYYIC